MTAPISAERLEELLAGTVGATRGPWTKCLHVFPVRDAHIRAEIHGCNICDVIEGTESSRGRVSRAEMQANATHIANCDPETIASLITELLSLRQFLDTVRAEGFATIKEAEKP